MSSDASKGQGIFEPFAASYQHRVDQHDEMERFIENRVNRGAEERKRRFQPNFSGAREYAGSLSPYRESFRRMIGMPDPSLFLGADEAGDLATIDHVGNHGKFSIERVRIPVAEGLSVYSLYLHPRRVRGPVPLIVACHGGGGCPEAICGLDIREPYHSIGFELAELGYAVWAPFILMTVGYGGDPTREHDRYYLDRNAMLIGMRIVGIEVYKIIHGLEALLEIYSEIDRTRIGMTGLSYGGYFTLCCGAVTTIFAACAPSAFFQDFGDAHSFVRKDGVGGSDGLFDGVLNSFDLAYTAALICPRPLLIQNGEADTVISIESARRAAPVVQGIYERLDIADRFEFHVHPGAHEYENAKIISFFGGALGKP